ncbi:hypothetical protein SLH46_12775 [Draconibacterium sp. IB214405]|uniref:hypothetical protein n=1 Tax=Draconibacterium sp. IB214405 TaxID=3097352 RepID=UPI002A0E3FEC|nr:hypothetical protein [Draconibacterium sp. IB214405]MDX8340067.1 hypothetical protein [Draconibacterium sp. IB214405]
MDTIRVLVAIFGCSVFLISCSNKNNQPFEATFTGDYAQVLTGDDVKDCPDGFECRVVVNFEGTATELGNISGTFNFCACGAEGEYAPTNSFLVSEDGDTLFFTCSGKVIEGRAADHPEFVTSYWRDPFVFKGGTGRFEGASGGGTTDDYNSSQDPNSHHHWKGTLILKK